MPSIYQQRVEYHGWVKSKSFSHFYTKYYAKPLIDISDKRDQLDYENKQWWSTEIEETTSLNVCDSVGRFSLLRKSSQTEKE